QTKSDRDWSSGVCSSDLAFGIHRVLRRGGVLGFLADRAITGVGERVEFFGRQTLLPSAHVALAHRTGAALVPAFTWRQNGMLFRSEERRVGKAGHARCGG